MSWEGFTCWYSDSQIKRLTFKTLLTQVRAIKEMLLAKFLVDGIFFEIVGTKIVYFWRRGNGKAKRWCGCLPGTEMINISLQTQ